MLPTICCTLTSTSLPAAAARRSPLLAAFRSSSRPRPSRPPRCRPPHLLVLAPYRAPHRRNGIGPDGVAAFEQVRIVLEPRRESPPPCPGTCILPGAEAPWFGLAGANAGANCSSRFASSIGRCLRNHGSVLNPLGFAVQVIRRSKLKRLNLSWCGHDTYSTYQTWRAGTSLCPRLYTQNIHKRQDNGPTEGNIDL